MRLDIFLNLELHDLLAEKGAWLHLDPKPGWYELEVRVLIRSDPPTYESLLRFEVFGTDFRTRTGLWDEILCQVRLVLLFNPS